ncbi:hypothetical protein [Halosimplex salinum]|uniref:hypothetical protein n=1 Tax=Halosimplex salinum TaxID=1710538 RepID=UPI0013DDC5CA|nr:hypothetical protein [Halosimplex salinum]
MGIRRTENRINGHRTNKIKVFLKDKSKSNIPESIDGVPIETASQRGEFVLDADRGCYNNDPISVINPGELLYGSGGTGSSGWIVDWDGSEYCLTANHVLTSDYNCDGSGLPIYDVDNNKVGNCDRYRDLWDWALIDVKDSISSSEYIDETSGGFPGDDYPEQASNFTRSGIKDLMDTDETVWQTGVGTGTTKGQILGINESYSNDKNCVDVFDDGVLTTCNVCGGDSGGPIYAESSLDIGDVSAISIYSGHYENDEMDEQNCQDQNIASQGYSTPAWKMKDSYNIEFY